MSTANVENKKTNMIFLFGAGASIDAGIPDTRKLVPHFEEYIRTNHSMLSDTLSAIVDKILIFNKRQMGREDIDIENLLETMDNIIHKDTNIILDFVKDGRLSEEIVQERIRELSDLLKAFIVSCMWARDETKIGYLQNLLSFPRPVEVYTTNYDTCIEQLCAMYRFSYTDGFDTAWRPKLFGDHYDVKCFKLHGSVTWYRTKAQQYLRNNLLLEAGGNPIKARTLTGEELEQLVLYPLHKWEYIGPLTELQLMLNHRLANSETEILVVVGYSFRDEYIVNMIWDAATSNEGLHVVIIDPNAQQIFDDKLRYLDKKTGRKSRIDNRVVCIPYPFAPVSEQLKDNYLASLTKGIESEEQNRTDADKGKDVDWIPTLRALVDCEFISRADKIADDFRIVWDFGMLTILPPPGEMGGYAHPDWDAEIFSERLLIGFKALLHSLIADDEYSSKWLNRTNGLLEFVSVGNFTATVSSYGYILSFSHFGGLSHRIKYFNLLGILRELNTQIDMKANLLREISQKADFGDKSRIMANWKSQMSDICSYLEELCGAPDDRGYMDEWERYYRARPDEGNHVKQELAGGRDPDVDQNLRRQIEKFLVDSERERLRSLFGGDYLRLSLA